jgi:hypothetical protein
LLLLLIRYRTTLTNQRINQALEHLIHYSFASLYRCWVGVWFLKSCCLGTSHHCVRLNHKPEFCFLGKGQFNYGFLDLYIHEIRIGWYQSKVLNQIISLLSSSLSMKVTNIRRVRSHHLRTVVILSI